MELALVFLILMALRGDLVYQVGQGVKATISGAGDIANKIANKAVETLTEDHIKVLANLRTLFLEANSMLNEQERDELVKFFALIDVDNKDSLEALKDLLDQGASCSPGILTEIDNIKDIFENYFKANKKISIHGFDYRSKEKISFRPAQVNDESNGYFDHKNTFVCVASIFISRYVGMLHRKSKSSDPRDRQTYDSLKKAFKGFVSKIKDTDIVKSPIPLCESSEQTLFSELEPHIEKLIGSIDSHASWNNLKDITSTLNRSCSAVASLASSSVVRVFDAKGFGSAFKLSTPDIAAGRITPYQTSRFSLPVPYVQRKTDYEKKWIKYNFGFRPLTFTKNNEENLNLLCPVTDLARTHAILCLQLDYSSNLSFDDALLLFNEKSEKLEKKHIPSDLHNFVDLESSSQDGALGKSQKLLQFTFLLSAIAKKQSMRRDSMGDQYFTSGEYKEWRLLFEEIIRDVIKSYNALCKDEYFKGVDRYLLSEPVRAESAIKVMPKPELPVSEKNPFKREIDILLETIRDDHPTNSLLHDDRLSFTKGLVEVGNWYLNLCDQEKNVLDRFTDSRQGDEDKLHHSNFQHVFLLSYMADLSGRKTDSKFLSAAQCVRDIREKVEITIQPKDRQYFNNWVSAHTNLSSSLKFDLSTGSVRLTADSAINYEKFKGVVTNLNSWHESFKPKKSEEKPGSQEEGQNPRIRGFEEIFQDLEKTFDVSKDTLSNAVGSSPKIKGESNNDEMKRQWAVLVYMLLRQTEGCKFFIMFRSNRWKNMPNTYSEMKEYCNSAGHHHSRTARALKIADIIVDKTLLGTQIEQRVSQGEIFKLIYKESRQATFFSRTRNKVGQKRLDELQTLDIAMCENYDKSSRAGKIYQGLVKPNSVGSQFTITGFNSPVVNL